jgi:hypothetical protein
MEARRHHYIEHEILRLVLRDSDHSGYPTGIRDLETFFRPKFPDVADPELVDTLKRLRPKYLTLWKWGFDQGRFVEYPVEIGDDNEFFRRGAIMLRRTPETDPRLQELAALFQAPDGEPPKKAFGFLP